MLCEVGLDYFIFPPLDSNATKNKQNWKYVQTFQKIFPILSNLSRKLKVLFKYLYPKFRQWKSYENGICYAAKLNMSSCHWFCISSSMGISYKPIIICITDIGNIAILQYRSIFSVLQCPAMSREPSPDPPHRRCPGVYSTAQYSTCCTVQGCCALGQVTLTRKLFQQNWRVDFTIMKGWCEIRLAWPSAA